MLFQNNWRVKHSKIEKLLSLQASPSEAIKDPKDSKEAFEEVENSKAITDVVEATAEKVGHIIVRRKLLTFTLQFKRSQQ